jgi:transcriptional regulator with XRE-family HTH domain
MEDLYREFGRLLREARRAAGLSQTTVATNVGLNRTSIANIESGRQRFPFHMLYRLSAALGVAPASILPEPAVSSAIPPSKLRRFVLADEETESISQFINSIRDESAGET